MAHCFITQLGKYPQKSMRHRSGFEKSMPLCASIGRCRTALPNFGDFPFDAFCTFHGSPGCTESEAICSLQKTLLQEIPQNARKKFRTIQAAYQKTEAAITALRKDSSAINRS